MAATLDAEQRLQLLERRAGQITQLTLQVQKLQRDNAQLRGQIELLHHQLAQIERRQRDRYQDITQRLTSIVRPATAAQPPLTLPPLAVQSPPPDKTAAESAVSAEQAYAAAWDLLSPQQRQYTQAVSAFQAFLVDYPQHKLAVNAHYWLGETHFLLQDNTAALAAFTRVVEDYPESAKVPDAWYMVGRIYQAQNDLSTARQVWQRLVQDYPGTQASVSAQNKLTQSAQSQVGADAES
jgi:tol-pal system protein YbgF